LIDKARKRYDTTKVKSCTELEQRVATKVTRVEAHSAPSNYQRRLLGLLSEKCFISIFGVKLRAACKYLERSAEHETRTDKRKRQQLWNRMHVRLRQ
jgi:hypothetical protein